jgi:hypothetical protein
LIVGRWSLKATTNEKRPTANENPRMSPFDSAFAACALPPMLRHFGVATLFRPPDGETDVPVTAIWGPESWEIRESMTGREEIRVRQITLSRTSDDEFDGLADPQRKGGFLLPEDGSYWAIDGVVEKTIPSITFRLIRAEPTEVGRRGYERLRK